MKKTKHPGGRPPLWTDPEVLQKLVDNYFENQEKVTLAGLAEALGIARSTLYDYDKKDEFSYIIKKARQKVEKRYEDYLIYSGTPTGVIFALKNMGWADNAKTDFTSGGKPIPILGNLNVPKNNSDKQTSKT